MNTKKYSQVLRKVIDFQDYANLTYALGTQLNERKDRFDKSAICRFHFGLDRYNQEPVDEWDIKTIIKDIAILRFSDNENYNLKDFIRNDHLIDGILDFDVTSESVMRKITNKIRQEFNLPKIGEGWVNETNLFNKIKNIMNKYNVDVKFHYKPTFLRLQELDIYFEYKNKKLE